MKERSKPEEYVQPVLRLTDVARILSVDPQTVRNYCMKGLLTRYRIGGRYRFKPSDVEALIEAGKEEFRKPRKPGQSWKYQGGEEAER